MGWFHIPAQSSALGRAKAGAPAAASCPAWLLISKHCKAWPGLAISRPVPGDYPALPVLGKSSIPERQSPGAQPGRSRHTHVHSPENGEELIPEANLFCSNPAAVTGSPQVPRLGSCWRITSLSCLLPVPACHIPPPGWEGEASLPALVYLGTEHEGCRALMSQNLEGADCGAAA